ncbi:MAG: sulfotransferase domain-containing protein, partial [Candidatus Puniceispirillaceae bacterium]
MTSNKIVWINSYPKSGNTWMRVFLANYFFAQGQEIGINDVFRYARMDTDDNLIDDYRKNTDHKTIATDGYPLTVTQYHDVLRYHLENTGNLLLKSHAPVHLIHNIPYFPKELTACFIYIVRHPLDTLISALNFNFGSRHFQDYDDIDDATMNERNQRQIFSFMTNDEERLSGDHLGCFLGSWKNHINSYLNAPYGRVKLVRYEDLLTNPVETFSDVVRHITGQCDLSRVEKSIAASQFSKLQKTEQEQTFRESSVTNDLPFFRQG